MVLYMFGHFENIKNLSMLVYLFAEQRMQLVLFKQRQFNLNHVSNFNRIFCSDEITFELLTSKDMLVAKQKRNERERCTHILEISPPALL